MSTRAQVRFATRESGQSFNQHPSAIHAQFYVHHDGYPEGLGVQIAESILDGRKMDNLEIEYLDTERGDLDYIYYVWQSPGKDTYITIFEDPSAFTDGKERCVFVGTPLELINKYEYNDR
tara:strand:- start:271 stop:630 length:360 start_codon:yes stop_codon:yes gene_type:complete